MGLATAVGACAVLLTSAGWVPQVRRALRTRSADDFSLGYLLLFGSGIACWLFYGILHRDAAIIVANAIALFALTLLLVIQRRGRQGPAIAAAPVLADAAPRGVEGVAD